MQRLNESRRPPGAFPGSLGQLGRTPYVGGTAPDQCLRLCTSEKMFPRSQFPGPPLEKTWNPGTKVAEWAQPTLSDVSVQPPELITRIRMLRLTLEGPVRPYPLRTCTDEYGCFWEGQKTSIWWLTLNSCLPTNANETFHLICNCLFEPRVYMRVSFSQDLSLVNGLTGIPRAPNLNIIVLWPWLNSTSASANCRPPHMDSPC